MQPKIPTQFNKQKQSTKKENWHRRSSSRFVELKGAMKSKIKTQVKRTETMLNTKRQLQEIKQPFCWAKGNNDTQDPNTIKTNRHNVQTNDRHRRSSNHLVELDPLCLSLWVAFCKRPIRDWSWSSRTRRGSQIDEVRHGEVIFEFTDFWECQLCAGEFVPSGIELFILMFSPCCIITGRQRDGWNVSLQGWKDKCPILTILEYC